MKTLTLVSFSQGDAHVRTVRRHCRRPGDGSAVMNNLGQIAQGGRRVLEFAGDILDYFRKEVPADKQVAVMRQALTQAAAMPQAEFDKKAEEIVEFVLADQPPKQKKAATEYIKLIPARIRATFTRPEDPTGATVPANFAVNRPEDILVFLPPRARSSRRATFHLKPRAGCLRNASASAGSAKSALEGGYRF